MIIYGIICLVARYTMALIYQYTIAGIYCNAFLLSKHFQDTF